MDEARKRTDRQLEKMTERITEIYQKSAHDISKKWDAYMERAAKRIKTHEKDLIDAQKVGDKEIIAKMEKRLRDAKQAVTTRDKHYREMLDAVTDQLAKANETALDYINGEMAKVYTWNYNEAANLAHGVGIKFNLINEQTVKQMILKGEDHMDTLRKKLNKPKDKRWNAKQITSALTQGIIQGESIPDISRKIFHSLEGNGQKDITRKNRAAAVRNARTMITGAENRGRNDSYKQLEEDGLVLMKVWMATPDGKTRDWHIDMDGQEVGVNESFIDGLGNELEYPGDPGGAPETVYNCRCSLVTDVKGFRQADGTISEIAVHDADAEHDEAIEAEQERRGTEPQVLQKTMVSNREEAYEALKTMFGIVEKNMKVIDEELLCENVNRLLELNERFKVLTPENYGYITSSQSGRAIAWTSTSFIPRPTGELPQTVRLGLVGAYYKDGNLLYETEKRSVERFWSMPCKEENYKTYSLCHEYGHMLESKISIARTDYDKIQEKISKKVNPSAGQIRKAYDDAEKACAKDIFKEISQIAKDRNPEFSLKENLSEYGRSNYYEAFAEMFANSQCGSPNELGNAMNEWLKKEGY